MTVPLSRTRQGIEVHNEVHAPLPGCPAPHTLLRPDLLSLLTLDTGHSGQRLRPTVHLQHLTPGRKWGPCGKRGCLICAPSRGALASEPRSHVSITALLGLTPTHTEDSPQAGRAVNLGIRRAAPLTATAPKSTCQGLDPGPLKEPG